MTPGAKFTPEWVPSHESRMPHSIESCGMFHLDHDKSKFGTR